VVAAVQGYAPDDLVDIADAFPLHAFDSRLSVLDKLNLKLHPRDSGVANNCC
jgi:hypothetical protein